jgi:hypothetical protein
MLLPVALAGLHNFCASCELLSTVLRHSSFERQRMEHATAWLGWVCHFTKRTELPPRRWIWHCNAGLCPVPNWRRKLPNPLEKHLKSAQHSLEAAI